MRSDVDQAGEAVMSVKGEKVMGDAGRVDVTAHRIHCVIRCWFCSIRAITASIRARGPFLSMFGVMCRFVRVEFCANKSRSVQEPRATSSQVSTVLVARGLQPEELVRYSPVRERTLTAFESAVVQVQETKRGASPQRLNMQDYQWSKGQR